jgi:Tfp pilus assembly protein PilX
MSRIARSRARVRRNSTARRGTALLAALATVVVLTAVTAVASRGARSSAAVVTNARADAIARAMAESGVLSAVARVESQLADATREGTSNGSDSTARMAAFDALTEERRGADGTVVPFTADTLDDGVFATALVNVSARFDVNSGDTEGLTQLFRTVAPASEAAAVAERIGARVRRDPRHTDAAALRARQRDSLAMTFLGRTLPGGDVGAFETLDDVAVFVGADAPWLSRIAPLLTVDGDGRIDRRHADPAVRRAASGSLVDTPTRLLVVARGWQAGHALTREVQAVYAVEGGELRLVRWREQSR